MIGPSLVIDGVSRSGEEAFGGLDQRFQGGEERRAGRAVDSAMAGLDRVQTTVGGDHAVTILSIRFADPSLAPAEICEMFRFRDGKLCEIKPYYIDPAPVLAACAAKQAAHG